MKYSVQTTKGHFDCFVQTRRFFCLIVRHSWGGRRRKKLLYRLWSQRGRGCTGFRRPFRRPPRKVWSPKKSCMTGSSDCFRALSESQNLSYALMSDLSLPLRGFFSRFRWAWCGDHIDIVDIEFEIYFPCWRTLSSVIAWVPRTRRRSCRFINNVGIGWMVVNDNDEIVNPNPSTFYNAREKINDWWCDESETPFLRNKVDVLRRCVVRDERAALRGRGPGHEEKRRPVQGALRVAQSDRRGADLAFALQRRSNVM